MTLCDLPNELILETISHLNSIRSYEPQSTAFKKRKEEIARQRENRVRQLALHALCLTSHHLRRIATPTLYASFIGSTTGYGFDPAILFHRTISSPGCAVGLNIRLAECLQYVENRLSNYLGNSLHDAGEYFDLYRLLSPYQELLANIIKLAPNINHMCVISLETDQVSFWNHVLPEVSGASIPSGLTTVAGHGLRKLRTLAFQINGEGPGSDEERAWFRRICSATASVPALVDLRASSVMSSSSELPAFSTFQNLQRLELTRCSLEFEEVAEILLACEGLRHIGCEWAYLDPQATPVSTVYPGLLKHADTLETLFWDMREIRFTSTSSRILGSLREFTRLESLTMCETFLEKPWPYLETPDQAIPENLVTILPVNLKSFAFLLSHIRRDYKLDDIVELHFFGQDVRTELPDLKEFSLRANRDTAPLLKKHFDEADVRFEVINEEEEEAAEAAH